MEAREPMEESLVVATSFPTKRKAESDPTEEIEESGDEIEESSDEIEESSDEIEESSDEIEEHGDEIEEHGDEIEESGNEIEESGDETEEIGDETEEIGDEFETIESINAYFRSKWITPEWDVDSFDGVEYDCFEEETEEIEEGDEQDWRRFKRQHIENKGFYVDQELWPMYKYSDYRVIDDMETYAGLGQTSREYLAEMACLCLQKYNQVKKSEDESFINVEFVEVMGGVLNFPKTLITFKAREKPDGPLVDYQAKVWIEFPEDKTYPDNYPVYHPILCRRDPSPKTSN